MSIDKSEKTKLSDLEILFKRDKLARELAESVLKALMEGLPSNKGERGIVTQQLCDMARQLLKLYSDK